MWQISLFSLILVDFTIAHSHIHIHSISSQKFHKPFGLTYIADKLYWADYLFHSVFSYDLATKEISRGEFRGGTFLPWYVIPTEDDPSVLYVNNGTTNYAAQWDQSRSTAELLDSIFSVESDIVNHTLTYAKVAPNCDIVFGTLGTKLCADQSDSGTYVYNQETGVRKILSDQIESGVVEWNADGTKLYQIRPCEDDVYEYDYDAETGNISNGRCVFKYKPRSRAGSQDKLRPVLFGMTLDTNGKLYLASYHGGVVLVVDPTCGKVEREIEMPGEVVAAVVWGGENLDTLFVSTGDVPRDFYSGTNLSGDILSPGSGKIYKVTGLNVTGVPQRPVCSKKLQCK